MLNVEDVTWLSNTHYSNMKHLNAIHTVALIMHPHVPTKEQLLMVPCHKCHILFFLQRWVVKSTTELGMGLDPWTIGSVEGIL